MISNYLFFILSRSFLIPGYRLGWIIVHDRQSIFGAELRHGLGNLCQRILGANSIVQGALPAILERTPQQFFDNAIRMIQVRPLPCVKVAL